MKKMLFCLMVPLSLSAQTPDEKSSKKESPTIQDSLVNDKSEETRKRLEGYRQRVLKGEKISDLAKLYSEDPGSAKKGGRYNGIKRGEFVPEFEEVAFKLKPGEISEVFETKYGFHFIQLIAKTETTVDVSHILLIRK